MQNTQNTFISEICSAITSLLRVCIYEPGNFFCSLYNTDTITQDSAIEQLFANYYRTVPYKFYVVTDHDKELHEIDWSILSHWNELENHIKERHYESLNDLTFHKPCEGNCIGAILESMSNCIKEYWNSIRLNIIASENTEIVGNICSIYDNYATFVIILESKLPTLSKLLKIVPSKGYPFSLWKFLHNQFVTHILGSLKDELIQIFIKEIKTIRKYIFHEKYGIHSSITSMKLCQLRQFGGILASNSLNEKSVHFLKSSEINIMSDSYDIITQLLQIQTNEIYNEYKEVIEKSRRSEVIMNDIRILKRILPEFVSKEIILICIEGSNKIMQINLLERELILNSYKKKNLHVKNSAKLLGIL